ncbi:hypothetical protein VULLAG_LOCUS14348 [Vulpes lagopus]
MVWPFSFHGGCQVWPGRGSKLLLAPQRNPRWAEAGKLQTGCSGRVGSPQVRVPAAKPSLFLPSGDSHGLPSHLRPAAK